jgi:hypothetical protein
LANDYIALGNAAENYLIVPKSLRINYRKLADILDKTGLDAVPTGDGLECPVNASPPISTAAG